MALFDGPRDLSLSLSLSLFSSVLSVHRGSLKFRGVEHEKMRETGEKGGRMSTIDWPDGKEASLGATLRVISGVNASDGYLVDPVARHTLVVARKFLDKSLSTMGHQGIRTGLVKRHVALGENRLGISNTRPSKFLLSSVDAVCARSSPSCFETIKIIYWTLFQGYSHFHPAREWLTRKWRIIYL